MTNIILVKQNSCFVSGWIKKRNSILFYTCNNNNNNNNNNLKVKYKKARTYVLKNITSIILQTTKSIYLSKY